MNQEKLIKHLKKIGKIGGMATTEKKVKASIENGKKGGRPRKHSVREAA